MVVFLLRSSESRGWGWVSWCGHLKPNQLPQPLQHCVEGQACLHVPLVPSPSAALSQKLGEQMLFTIDFLCWISKDHRKLLIPFPWRPQRTTIRDDEEVACKCDCISAALPSSSRIPSAVCTSIGNEDPSSGSVGQGIWCWGAGVCVIHISVFLLPLATSSLIPWSEERLMLTWSDPALN